MSYNRGKKFLKKNPKEGYHLKYNGSKMCEGDLPIMFSAIGQLLVLHVSVNPEIDENSSQDDLFKVLLTPLKTAFETRGYTDEDFRNFYNAFKELNDNAPETLIAILDGKGGAMYPNGTVGFFNKKHL